MTLALVAGEGALPRHLAQYLSDYLLCEVEGFPSDLGAALVFRLETLGTFIATLGHQGVTEICFAGRIPRPALDPAKIDAATMPLVPQMMQALGQGDDAALRVLLGFFEDAGIAIKAAHDIAPDLIPVAGAHSATHPNDAQQNDIKRGRNIITAMAAADVGQACVVAGGQALAVEGFGGTDWMLRSLANDPLDRQGGVLIKAPKPGQDCRIDLPLIGPDTVTLAAKAQLTGIAIKAGGVMMLDPQTCRDKADAAGLFVWVYQ